MEVKKDPRESMQAARLESIEKLPEAPRLAVLRVNPVGGAAPRFSAGNACPVAFAAGGQVAVRWYSIASAPEQRDHLLFYVVDTGESGATHALFSLKPGAEMWYGAPAGKFTLERSACRHLAFVASGTGLAPYVSMLRHLDAQAQAGRPVPRAVTLWHGACYAAELGFRAELEQLERRAPFSFRYVPCVSRAASDPRFSPVELTRGRADEALALVLGLPSPGGFAERPRLAERQRAGALLARHPPGDTALFLCGNPKMIQAFDQAAQGGPYHQHLIYERWW